MTGPGGRSLASPQRIPTESPEGAPDPVASILAEAAETVLEAWPSDSPSRKRDEVAACLRDMRRALAYGDRENWPPEIAETMARDRSLARKLLRSLWLEVVDRSGSRGTEHRPEDLLDALRRLEALRKASLPREAQEFVSRLTDPDGFELLVEVAHDLRSPLTSITFMAETLRAGYSGSLTDLQKDQLGLIWSAAFGMMSVLSDLMDLAKERANMFEDSPGPFSISGVFEELRQMVEPMVVVKGIELRIEAPHARAGDRPSPRSLSGPSQSHDECHQVHRGGIRRGRRPDRGPGSSGVFREGYGAGHR